MGETVDVLVTGIFACFLSELNSNTTQEATTDPESAEEESRPSYAPYETIHMRERTQGRGNR